MISELLLTILPSLIVLLILFIIITSVIDIDRVVLIKATCAGIIVTVPAIITMKVIGVFITIVLPLSLPFIIFQLLSALNEEFYKYVTIKLFACPKRHTITAIFIGGGFALCETLYLSFGNIESAILRPYTAMPIHIVTAVILSKGLHKKRYFFIALLLHLSYNLILS